MEKGGQDALAGAPSLSWERSQARSPARTHSWGHVGPRATASEVGIKGGTPGFLVRTWPSHQTRSWEPPGGWPSGGSRGDHGEH